MWLKIPYVAGRDERSHKEHLLRTYYDRLKQIDENNRDLTSFFFAVNTATLAIVMQLLKEDWQRLALAIVGYFASVALALIGYKSYWSWQAYTKEMHRLEDELDYDIAAKYEEQLRPEPGPVRAGDKGAAAVQLSVSDSLGLSYSSISCSLSRRRGSLTHYCRGFTWCVGYSPYCLFALGISGRHIATNGALGGFACAVGAGHLRWRHRI